MVCQHRQGWSKVRWRSFHPDPGLFMRSFHLVRTIIVPKFRFLPVGLAALALAACEVQPVVTSAATPAKPETPPAITAPDITPAAEDGGETTETMVTEVAETTDALVSETAPDTGEDGAATQTAAAGNAASDAPGDAGADAPAAVDAGGAETASEDLQTDLSVAEPETTPEPENLPAGEAADSDITKDDTVTDETATDKAAGDDTAVTELALAAPPPPPSPPPSPPPPAELAPASLIGVSPDMLRARLGEADFARQEGDMKTWQYRFADCVVDYFLFPQDGASRVASWAWRSPVVGMTVDATSCRRALARRDSAGG